MPDGLEVGPELLERTAVLLRLALIRAEGMGEAALSALGITGREYGILAVIRSAAESRPQREVGAALGIDRTTTMKVVVHLEVRGLLERAVDPHDRRAYRLSLTAEGRRAVNAADRLLTQCDTRFVSGRLSGEESVRLRELLSRLI